MTVKPHDSSFRDGDTPTAHVRCYSRALGMVVTHSARLCQLVDDG